MRSQPGFTLIEIVFVIGVLGVLATFGFQSLSGSGRVTDLVQAEDKVIAELRKARSWTLHRLPPPPNDRPEEQTARINKRAGSSVDVCPMTVRFTVGDGNKNSVKSVDCKCTSSCPGTEPEYSISLTTDDGDSQSKLCLNGTTGRVERAPCD